VISILQYDTQIFSSLRIVKGPPTGPPPPSPELNNFTPQLSQPISSMAFPYHTDINALNYQTFIYSSLSPFSFFSCACYVPCPNAEIYVAEWSPIVLWGSRKTVFQILLNNFYQLQFSSERSSVPAYIIWDLWWTKWQCDRFLSEHFSPPLSASFQQCSVLVSIRPICHFLNFLGFIAGGKEAVLTGTAFVWVRPIT